MPFPIKILTRRKEKLSARSCKMLFLEELRVGPLRKIVRKVKLFIGENICFGKLSSGKSDKTK